MNTAILINSIRNNIRSKKTKEETKMNSEKIMNYQQTGTINSVGLESHFKIDLPVKSRHSALEEYKILKKSDPRSAEELLQGWKHKTCKKYQQTRTINPDGSVSQFKLDLPLKRRHSALEEYKILKKTDPRSAEELLQGWKFYI
jgi:hypothetical protein